MGQLPLREAYSAAFAKNIPGTRTKARCVNGGPLFIASTLPQRSLPPVSKNRSGWTLGRDRRGKAVLCLGLRARQLASPGGLSLSAWFTLITNMICDPNHIAADHGRDNVLSPGLAAYFT